MWRAFDAIKAIVEQRKKLLHSDRDYVAAREALQKESENQKIAKQEFSQSRNELEILTDQINRLKAELSKAEALHNESEKNLSIKSKNLELANSKFNETSATVDSLNNSVNELKQSILGEIKKRYLGPEKLISEVNVKDNGSESTRIHALGDLHGWAPGLISYLTHHNLAKIEISGIQVYDSQSDGKITLNIDSMCELFPDLHEHLSESDFPNVDVERESFVHAGILGQPAGELNLRSSYCDIDAEWIGNNEFLIQIGDVFDRADHGEISAEILRQLIIQAPAHVFVLVGNHEEFLLCDQYNGWFRNEIKWSYDTRLQRGNTRNLPQLYPQSTEEELLKDTYEKYKQSAAMLYLTQYFAKRKLSSDRYSELPYISSEELEIYSERILNGEWEGYKAASELHDRILGSATTTGVRFPGAFALLAIGNCIFMHAEPNGLSKYLSSLTSESIIALREPVQIGNRDYLFDDLQICFDGDSYSSKNTELFWARGASNGHEALNSKFAHLTEKIIKIFPGVRNIIHGHTPVPHEHDANKPHTYVGRKLGLDVTTKTGEIRVYNIDEGITPVYQNKMSTREKMINIPIGLQLPSQIKTLHDNGDLIPEDELWELNSMFVERESDHFTVGRELKILQSPEQYKISGPGFIEVSSKFDDKNHYAYTKEDEFRAKPYEFCWLSITNPENLTNPLVGKKPPSDGVYRVQTKNHGSITLLDNLLNILNLKSFPSFTGLTKKKRVQPFECQVEVKKYISDILTEMASSEEIIQSSGRSEIAKSRGIFLAARSTNDSNILDFSILNMDEEKTFIFSNSGNNTSLKKLAVKVKPGQCAYGSWAEMITDSAVVISMQDVNGKHTVISSAVFGKSKQKPYSQGTKITEHLIITDNTQSKELDNNAAILDNDTVRETNSSPENREVQLGNRSKKGTGKSELESHGEISPVKNPISSSHTNGARTGNLRDSVSEVLTLNGSQGADEVDANAAEDVADTTAKQAGDNDPKQMEAAAKPAMEAAAEPDMEAEAKDVKEAEPMAAKEAEVELDEVEKERQAAALHAKKVAEANRKYTDREM